MKKLSAPTKALLLFAIVLLALPSCEDDKKECPPSDRVGAVCKDGTKSPATGSGACAGHGGVDYWECR